MLHKAQRFGIAPLHYAVRLADAAACAALTERLLELDTVDVNAVDAKGNTPLHDLCEFGCASNVALIAHKLLQAG